MGWLESLLWAGEYAPPEISGQLERAYDVPAFDLLILPARPVVLGSSAVAPPKVSYLNGHEKTV